MLVRGRLAKTAIRRLVVASTAASLRRTLSPKVLQEAWHSVEVGGRVALAELFSRWVALGYQREEAVEVPGSFSHRGGIVDIYPVSSPLPARIELLNDEVGEHTPLRPHLSAVGAHGGEGQCHTC